MGGACLLLSIAAAFLSSSCATLGSGAGMQLPPEALSSPQRYVVVTIRNNVAATALGVASTPRGYNNIAPYPAGRQARGHAQALAGRYRLQPVAAWPIAVLGVHCLVYRIPEAADRDRLLGELHRDSRVESAQALEIFKTRGDGYNDTYAGLQHNLDELAVPQAQRWSRGRGVRVAVIDSGVDVDHPDLHGRIAGWSDFVATDAAQFRRDRHGTAVAGVIAAVANNNIGIVGIAPEVRLTALRACWENGASDAAVCNTFTLAQALAAAIDARVDVVNLSLAGPSDALLARLVKRGQQAGMIFVGAAPPATTGSLAGFPLEVDGVIGVAAIESGRIDDSLIAAPGEDIFTLAPAGGYSAVSGSSMAAAEVTGMIALLRTYDGNLTPGEARALLADSQRTVTTARGTRQVINACLAIAALSPGLSCEANLRQAVRGREH